MNQKIVDQDRLVSISESMRKQGRKLVLTNGCFDLLHLGHVRYLQAARSLGDSLVVALNGDDSVRSLKGNGRPLNSAQNRAEVIAALQSVDHVVIFPELRVTRLIEQLRPAIYVKGGDYSTLSLNPEERAALEKVGAQVQIVPFEPGYSTSKMISQIKQLSEK
jgi:D-glycero-beta-D-manno-heptose 1-phosphate adenylyltransferase